MKNIGPGILNARQIEILRMIADYCDKKRNSQLQGPPREPGWNKHLPLFGEDEGAKAPGKDK
jgi:hypothetical protein